MENADWLGVIRSSDQAICWPGMPTAGRGRRRSTFSCFVPAASSTAEASGGRWAISWLLLPRRRRRRRIESSTRVGRGFSAARVGAFPCPRSTLRLRRFRIAWAGIAGRPSLLHVNITGRGSTTRKLVLTAVARAVALPYVLHIHDYDYAADVRARGGRMRRLVRGMFAAAAQIIVLGTEAEPDSARRARAAGRAASWSCRTRCPIRTLRRGRPRLWRRQTRRTSCFSAISAPARACRNSWRRWRARRWPRLPWRATLAGGGPGGGVPGPRGRPWPR